MMKRLIFNKLFVLFTVMLIIGFLIGYDYSVSVSRDESGPVIEIIKFLLP